jgi:hypothetical protein
MRWEGKGNLFHSTLYSPCTLRAMPHLKEGLHKLSLTDKLPSSAHSINPPKDQVYHDLLLALDAIKTSSTWCRCRYKWGSPGRIGSPPPPHLRISWAWQGNCRNLLFPLHPEASIEPRGRGPSCSDGLFPLSESEVWLWMQQEFLEAWSVQFYFAMPPV